MYLVCAFDFNWNYLGLLVFSAEGYGSLLPPGFLFPPIIKLKIKKSAKSGVKHHHSLNQLYKSL